MSKTSQKQGSEEEWSYCSNVPKRIEKQGIEVWLGYCANEPMGVSSHMSKNRTKLGSEEKWRYDPMCLRKLRSKALREVWNIAPMGQ